MKFESHACRVSQGLFRKSVKMVLAKILFRGYEILSRGQEILSRGHKIKKISATVQRSVINEFNWIKKCQHPQLLAKPIECL